MTTDDFKRLPFKYVCGLSTGDGAHREFRNDEHGITVLTSTKKYINHWGETECTWLLDDDENEYKSVEAVVDAINKKGKSVEG